MGTAANKITNACGRAERRGAPCRNLAARRTHPGVTGSPHGSDQSHRGAGEGARAGRPVQERRSLPDQARLRRHPGRRLPRRRLLRFHEALLQGRQRTGARRPRPRTVRPPRRRRHRARGVLLHRRRRRHRDRPRRPPRTDRTDRGRPRTHGQDQLPPGHGRGHRPLPRQRGPPPRPGRLPDRRRPDQPARRRAVPVQGGPAAAVLAVRRLRRPGQPPVRLPAQTRRTGGTGQTGRRQRRLLPRRPRPLALSDTELYDRLVGEFPTWLAAARAKGIVRA